MAELQSTAEKMDRSVVSLEEINAIEWNAFQNQKRDLITLKYDGAVDFTARDQWDTYQLWLLEAARLYRNVFQGRV